MKKYIKLLMISVVTFLASISVAYAQENVKAKDLLKAAESINPDVTDVFVIGEYAFTSNHQLTSQDIMLAARSIKVQDENGKTNKDPIYKEMVMQYFSRTMNNKGEYTEWKIENSQIGETKIENLDKEINVYYIDYKYIEKVDVDNLVNTAMNNLSNDLFEKKEISGNTATVDIKTDALTKKIDEGMASGVFPMLTNLLNTTDGKIKSIDFEFNGTKLTLKRENLNISSLADWLKENCKKIFGKDLKDVILADLLDKEFTATINLDESDKNSYISKDNGTTSEKYTIKFTGKRQIKNTVDIAKKALNVLNNDIFKFKNTDIIDGKATVEIEKSKLNDHIEKGMKSGVIELLNKLVNADDVESIDFEATTKSGEEITYSLKKGFKETELLDWFTINCKDILGYDPKDALVADLLNASFKAKINLKNYAEKASNDPEKYTISFNSEVPVVEPETIKKSMEKSVNTSLFEMDEERSSNQNIIMKVKDIDKEITQGMKSGLFTALLNAANNEGVESIDFKYNSLTFSFTKNTGFSELVTWFENNKKAIFGDKNKITLADLNNKTFDVKINVGRVGKLKDNAENTYKITMLKTHNVTFHDDHSKDNQKEVIAVYDDEIIPENEVKKRSKRSTDVETDIFLGWYEEIKEGEDKEDKFDFDNTKITKDMELDAHWGTKLSNEENKKVTAATKNALEIINSHSTEGKLNIKVEKGKITITNMGEDDPSLYDMLYGSGVQTAMNQLLDTENTNIKSLTMKFESNDINETAEIDRSVLNSPMKFVDSFDDIYKKVMGKSEVEGTLITTATWNDLSSFIDNLKVKVNLIDGKVFDDETNGEYTFELKNKDQD